MQLLDPRNLPYVVLRRFPLPPWLHWRLVSLFGTRFVCGVFGMVNDGDGRLLLCRHTYRSGYPWGMPGGWMIRGETPLAALEREVREETGFAVQAERLLLVGVTPDRPKLEFVVGARLLGGRFRPSREVSAIHWWQPEDGEPPVQPDERRLLAQAAALGPHEVGWYAFPWARPG